MKHLGAALGLVLFLGPCSRGTGGSGKAAPAVSIAPIDADAAGGAPLTLLEPKRAIAIADANGDGIDDLFVIGYAPHADARLVAIDGRTRTVLWRGEPLHPWVTTASGERAMLFAAGGTVALAPGFRTIAFYDARTGARKGATELPGIPTEPACVDPEHPTRIYAELEVGGPRPPRGTFVDLATMKAEPAPRPTWCRASHSETDADVEKCAFSHWQRSGRTTCRSGAAATSIQSFVPSVVLTAPEATVAVGNAPRIVFDSGASEEGIPELVGLAHGKELWRYSFPDVTIGSARTDHRITKVDITPGGIVAILDIASSPIKVAGSSVTMLDLAGKPRWTRTLEGAVAEEPRVANGRLYLARHKPYESEPWYSPDASVDVLDAASGTTIYSVGGGQPIGGAEGTAPAIPSAPAAPPATELLAPNDSGQLTLPSAATATAILDVNGDGADDVVAFGKIESVGDKQLRVVALDGKSEKLVWASPLVQPTPTHGFAPSILVAGGGHVALTNGWSELELFDAPTGARVKSIPLAATPNAPPCRYAPDKAFLPIDDRDKHALLPDGILVDLATGTARSGPPPQACAIPADAMRECYPTPSRRARCSHGDGRFTLTAPEAKVTFELTGARENVVARVDPATGKPRWKRTIDKTKDSHFQDGPIAEADVTPVGVVVLVPQVAALQTFAERLVVLDLETGAPRFERTFARPRISLPIVSGTVLYTPAGDRIFALDAATGATLRTFGGEKVTGSTVEPISK